MDQREDVRHAADRLFFSPLCDLWPRGDSRSERRPETYRWEPAFCVLPGDAAPARNAQPGDGGLW